MDDMLIVKINGVIMSAEYLKMLHDNIFKQKESGVIILPSFCEALVVPKNIEIKVEGDSNGAN